VIWRPARRRVWQAAAAGAIALVGVRAWPRPPLRDSVPASTIVWSADGAVLRVTRASDDQYRTWVPLEAMSPALVDAFLIKEDRWFYWHPGVNPVALARAAARTYGGSARQGGSTITMQLARLRGSLSTRTPTGKLRQMVDALWLELRYSKRALLEAYLNVVPLGGNVEGVGAASRLYFDKTPDRVTLGEALTLAVIPQHPAGRAGCSGSEASLLAARAQLATAWTRVHGGTDEERRQLALPVLAGRRGAMPMAAPHFVDAVLADRPATGRVDTTLDLGLQRLVERQLDRYLRQYGPRGIRNASAVLVDTRDMAVKAWVGSADYWNAGIDGQVNGVLAKRSPGSTLKPFVYALALDQGVLHPRTMLRDAPSAFGPYAPENFDGRFNGPIAAEEALIRSRNVPAVWVATQLRQPSLYQFLESAGVRDLRPAEFYGLALPLGGGEVTMEELAGLYAMLANGGLLRPLRAMAADPSVDGVRLLSAEAAFVTLDMLRHNPRPDGDGALPPRTRWPVAWKTGTSWGFRDAWSAGVIGRYVLVVWIGDFRGQGNPAFVGTDAAAPLFFRIADAVNLARPDDTPPPAVAPAGVTRVEVCADSGDLPNADCPRTVATWYIPGRSPIRVSQLHRTVGIDPSTGRAVCPPYPPGTRLEVFEYWSSDMLRLFRQSGVPRRTPPPAAECAADAADGPRIASPIRGLSYALRAATARSMPAQTIPLDATAAGDASRLFWFDGRALIGAQSTAGAPLAWRPTDAGIHVVRVVDDRGRSAEREVDVQFTR
jgi:penicillin-binding protein 1C